MTKKIVEKAVQENEDKMYKLMEKEMRRTSTDKGRNVQVRFTALYDSYQNLFLFATKIIFCTVNIYF
jgi:hypothetical protein